MTAPTPTTNWLQLARDAYSASNSYFDASIRTAVEQDLRQFQGQHPAGSKYLGESGRGRSKLFRPKTRAVIRKNEAVAAEAFFSTTDKINVAPENDDDEVRLASAAVMQELLQYRLSKSIAWFQTVIGAYQDAQAVGVVASHQYWEYDEKKKRDRPAIRLVPVENLRFDPGADWTDPVGTSPYIVELIPMYLKDVRARMQTPDPKTGQPKWYPLDDSVIMQAARQYTDSIRQQREGNRLDPKGQPQGNNQFNIVWVHKNIVEVDGVDWVYYTLGTDQMLSRPVPLRQLYSHGKRPYVVGVAVIEAHKNYPSSVPRLTRDVQAEINEVANSRIDNVKLVLNKRYFARRNRQVDLRSITRNVPGSVTLMQDIDDVKPVEFSDVTGSSYKEQEVLNLDFDDVSGAFSQSSVQSNRQMNETVGGMNLLSTSANQVASYQLRTFVETWVEPVLRQLVLLEQYYETSDTIIALAGKRAGIFQKFGIDSVTDEMLMGEFTLTVNVGMGVTNPLAQVDQFMRGMDSLKRVLEGNVLQQYGLKIEEVVKELFGKLGYRDGARFFQFADQDPMVAQLQAQVQQLQQALDAKMPPELLKAQVDKIRAEIAALDPKNKLTLAQAIKTGVEAEFSAMQGAEVVATLPQVAPIADELMRAAGYTVPTPPGVDPNMVSPDVLPAPPVSPQAIPQIPAPTVTHGQMAAANGALLPTAAGDTSPNTPAAPVTPGMGERRGIETMRFDSGPPGLADGGAVDSTIAQEAKQQALQQRLLYPEAYGARASTGLTISGHTDDTMLGAGLNPVSGRPLAVGQRLAYDTALNARSLTPRFDSDAALPPAHSYSAPPAVAGLPPLVPGGVPPLVPDPALSSYYADGGYVSVLERGDMASPAYRAQLERQQGLEGVYPEQYLAGPIRSIAAAARGAVSTLAPRLGVRASETAGGIFRAPSPVLDEGAIGSRVGPMNYAPGLDPRNVRATIDDAASAIPGRMAMGAITDGVPAVGNYFNEVQRQQGDRTYQTLPATLQPGYAQSGYAEGGLIQGPGSGTSDSIAAQAGDRPIAVSNGEYEIPPAVVSALGEDFFKQLLARFHTPVRGPRAAPQGAPLSITPGSFIIPRDVVQALGVPFFDELVARFGGARPQPTTP